MKLLIDGYNLLQAAGQFGTAAGIGTLESARIALLDFLVAALSPADARRTVIVFDAASSPPGRPSTIEHEGITVRFSRRKDTADDLIEEIIETVADPRHLTVVSSDHRVQRAARRRRATPVDSEVWYREARSRISPSPQSPGSTPLSESSRTDLIDSPELANPFPAEYLDELKREIDGQL